MILTKLSILISLVLFIFVEPSQKRKIIGFICSKLQCLRIFNFMLIVREHFTSVARSFFNLFKTRGLRLKRLCGQWSNDYDFDFWDDLKKGDFE